MRGPGVRLDLDVRRVWKCPACQLVRRVSGDLTAIRCHCAGEPWMQLVDERTSRPRVQQTLEVRELTVDSFQLTEEELAKPLPGRIRRRSGPRNGADEAPGTAGDTNPPGNDRPAAAGGRNRPPRDGRVETGNAPEGPASTSRARPPRGPKRPRPTGESETTPSAMAPDTRPSPAGDDFAAGLDLPQTQRPDTDGSAAESSR